MQAPEVSEQDLIQLIKKHKNIERKVPEPQAKQSEPKKQVEPVVVDRESDNHESKLTSGRLRQQ